MYPTLTKIWESAFTFDDATMKALEDNLGLWTVARAGPISLYKKYFLKKWNPNSLSSEKSSHTQRPNHNYEFYPKEAYAGGK